MSRKYYEAYDDRYRQVHSRNLEWFQPESSPIVMEVISACGLKKSHNILELGCGEGRDAIDLLKKGYQLLATDISSEAIRYCTEKAPEFETHFQVLDCVKDNLNARFDFIYAIAVVHMLVNDEDRNSFYRFYSNHLTDDGFGLICSMGDGTFERSSDVSNAFELQERIHAPTGQKVFVAGTSCRMVSFETFHKEINANGLKVIRSGITSVGEDFPQMMYVIVQKRLREEMHDE